MKNVLLISGGIVLLGATYLLYHQSKAKNMTPSQALRNLAARRHRHHHRVGIGHHGRPARGSYPGSYYDPYYLYDYFPYDLYYGYGYYGLPVYPSTYLTGASGPALQCCAHPETCGHPKNSTFCCKYPYMCTPKI